MEQLEPRGLENLLNQPVSRRSFGITALALGGLALTGCQREPKLVVSPEDKAQAAEILHLNQALVSEFVRGDLVNNYGVKFDPIDMKTLYDFRRNPAGGGYRIHSDAKLGSGDRSMHMVLGQRFDKDEQLKGSDMGIFTPLKGDVLAEFAKVGMMKRSSGGDYDYIPEDHFIDAAKLAFNLPPDVQWGAVYVRSANTIKAARVLDGNYHTQGGKEVKVSVDSRGGIRLTVSRP